MPKMGFNLCQKWDLISAKNGILYFLFGFLLKQEWIKVILLDNLFLLGSVADKILVDGKEDKS